MNTKPQDTLESGAQWVIKAIAPKDQQQLWMDHYRANRNAWNMGVGALGGATVAALANGAADAFGRDDRGNDGGSSWGWLAPMALGAAGMWAWNKWGGALKNTLNNYAKAAQTQAQNKRKMTEVGERFANTASGNSFMRTDAEKNAESWVEEQQKYFNSTPEQRQKYRQERKRQQQQAQRDRQAFAQAQKASVVPQTTAPLASRRAVLEAEGAPEEYIKSQNIPEYKPPVAPFRAQQKKQVPLVPSTRNILQQGLR